MVCLAYAELAAAGNLGLVRVDEGDDDVQVGDFGQLGSSSFRLARRGWSGLYCGARLVTSDFEEIRSGFPARGKDLLISCSLQFLMRCFT